MENFLNSRKLVWLFAVIGILAVVIIVIAAVVHKRANQTSNKTSAGEPQITKRDIDPAHLPDHFPSNIPIETGVTITDNNVQTASDGRFQATRSFQTKKSLDDNFKLYQDYFQKDNWTITTTVNLPGYKAISATKGDSNIQVSLNDNPTTKLKTVDIYVVQQVKPEGQK